MNKLLALVLLAACVVAGPTNVSPQPSQGLDCLEHDNALFSCIFVKTVSALDRAARSSDIEIADGVTFVRDLPSKFLHLFMSKLCVWYFQECKNDWINNFNIATFSETFNFDRLFKINIITLYI